MAHLGTKTSDGQLSFDKYVKNNPKWSSSMKFVVEVGANQVPIFTIKENKPVESGNVVGGGQPIHIMSKSFKTLGRSRYAKIKLSGNSGIQGYLNISHIRKPTNTDVMKSENLAITELDQAIRKIQIPVTIIVNRSGGGGQMIAKEIVEARKIGGTAKADITLVDKYGVPQMWISHKKEGDASAFQQYGGISAQSSAKIYNHQEVKQFMRKVTQHLEGEYINEKELKKSLDFLSSRNISKIDTQAKTVVVLNKHGHQRLATQIFNMDVATYPKFLQNPYNYVDWGELNYLTSKLSTPLYSKIRSSDLKRMSLFGPDVGGGFGTNNVNLIGQGNPTLTPMQGDGMFNLSFSSHMISNEDMPECRTPSSFDCIYEPVFVATYRAGRGFTVDNKTYKGARLGIAPLAMVKSRQGIIEI